MNILIANDDGVFAPGLQALAQALKPLGRVVVVAPESERSGYSSALTLDRPLRPIQISEDVWAVNGTTPFGRPGISDMASSSKIHLLMNILKSRVKRQQLNSSFSLILRNLTLGLHG